MSSEPPLPILYVEGKDDISVVNGLLFRHGIDTEAGKRFLQIKDLESIDDVLATMPDAIKASTDRPVGFVIDIDIKISSRWDAVKQRLKEIGFDAPDECPPTGLAGKLPDYPHSFGIWLMPDCATDHLKLEDLVATLIPVNDPVWPHANASVTEAVRLVDFANSGIIEESGRWQRFRDVDRIKAVIHTWLAWQFKPGAPIGAAIKARILGHDSPQALAFLSWLRQLYSLPLI